MEEKLGPIDVWVNNAMTSVFAPFTEVTTEEFERVTRVTYLGAVHGTLSALRRMKPRDRGTIVQVGSALAYRSIPLQSAYCGAKAGVRGFTDSIRSELLHDHSRVHVTAVNLPAPPIFQPEVAANAIVFAAAQRRREHNVGFSTWLAIVGGAKLGPGVGDRYLGATGYDAQQTDEPRNELRPDNLFHPVPGDHGAHGPFDRQAKSVSFTSSISEHRLAATLAFALAGVGGIALLKALR